ncbi:MAG: TetR/AcrR family transcriptional regulator [Pseudomonadota bacterium]
MSVETLNTARHESILQAAIGVFLRYGFRKTSMDDLARAAGISRQGLYGHFATKDVLFKESVIYLTHQNRIKAHAVLARNDLAIEERLLGVFVALKTHNDGSDMSQEHMAELLATASQLVGPAIAELENVLVSDLTHALQSSDVAAKWEKLGLTAEDLARHLFSVSHGIKHYVKTTAEYKERMRVAVSIICGANVHNVSSVKIQ